MNEYSISIIENKKIAKIDLNFESLCENVSFTIIKSQKILDNEIAKMELNTILTGLYKRNIYSDGEYYILSARENVQRFPIKTKNLISYNEYRKYFANVYKKEEDRHFVIGDIPSKFAKMFFKPSQYKRKITNYYDLFDGEIYELKNGNVIIDREKDSWGFAIDFKDALASLLFTE
jgi:hypothetical protein